MKNYEIDVLDQPKKIYPALHHLHAENSSGKKISFTNYYMKINNKPFFGRSGEFHFSRYSHHDWEDEIIKMKMGGINIISSYIFWNHHEEIENEFNWTGNKNVRKFIELCHKHGLYVLIRIGPFNHGEVRNGGIPDWLYGRPFELRSNDEEYLFYVKRLYREIGQQVEGLLFKDNGPIIGTQLENEYEHAGAPWEISTGTSLEWVTAGRDGEAHIKKLKEIAKAAGIDTPLYTSTAWGGAIAPTEEVLPLWGGYAYWPWIFYGDIEEHPATPNFIFRDYHNEDMPETFDFEPQYHPETVPYVCAEMGGGMTVFYNYRFKLPYESVDALSAIKVAGGCNFVGYYVYHGGSNPKGEKSPFLNETTTPKISYDYQAPIGEFGQLRESYHRLKRQHLFYEQYGESFAKTRTVLAQDPSEMQPEDVNTVRYAVRSDGTSGYLYINNFQDHVETNEQKDFSISIKLEKETIRFPHTGSLTIAKDTNCILPFNLYLAGVRLKCATTQLITEVKHNNEMYYFFFIPKGMTGEYVFCRDHVAGVVVDKGVVIDRDDSIVVKVDDVMSVAKITSQHGEKINICTLTDQESLHIWKAKLKGQERILMTEANVLIAEEDFRLEYSDLDEVQVKVFPGLGTNIKANEQTIMEEKDGLFSKYVIPAQKKNIDLYVKSINSHQATIQLHNQAFQDLKEIILNIDYLGDIGYAFIDGELVHDNFCNGRVWEIGLKHLKEELSENDMYVYITPIKEGVQVKNDTPMAGRKEMTEKEISEIKAITAKPVYELEIKY